MSGTESPSEPDPDVATGPMIQWFPVTTAVEEYGSVLEETGYAVWSVDFRLLRSTVDEMDDAISDVYDLRLPVRVEVPHATIGIDDESVDRMFVVGVARPNSVPRGVNSMGQFIATVTLGTFNQDDVIHAHDDMQRNDRDGVIWFLENQQGVGEAFAHAVGDGWLVVGFESAVEAIVDSVHECVDRYFETSDAIAEAVEPIDDHTFFGATTHETHPETDIESGMIEGQVAQGDGTRFESGNPYLRLVHVFETRASIKEWAVTDWIEDQFRTIREYSVSTDERTVIVDGEIDLSERIVPDFTMGFGMLSMFSEDADKMHEGPV